MQADLTLLSLATLPIQPGWPDSSARTKGSTFPQMALHANEEVVLDSLQQMATFGSVNLYCKLRHEAIGNSTDGELL